jgi:hypothetical protein
VLLAYIGEFYLSKLGSEVGNSKVVVFPMVQNFQKSGKHAEPKKALCLSSLRRFRQLCRVLGFFQLSPAAFPYTLSAFG